MNFEKQLNFSNRLLAFSLTIAATHSACKPVSERRPLGVLSMTKKLNPTFCSYLQMIIVLVRLMILEILK
jgi:hypothetical protein